MRKHTVVIAISVIASWGCAEETSTSSNTPSTMADDQGTSPDVDTLVDMRVADIGGTPDLGMDPDSGPHTEPGCVPAREEFETVLPILETSCGQCHGESLQYGAPYSVVDYDLLVAGEEGSRKIDAVVREVRLGGMPPYGQPPLMAADQATLLDWATCGDNMGEPPVGPNPGGLDVSRPMYTADGDLSAEAVAIEYRAQNAVVAPDEDDVYRCYSFQWNAGDQRLIHRFEPIVDDSRVLHHIVLYKVPIGPGGGAEVGCGSDLEGAIYAWAPGQVPFQFPGGGLDVNNSHRYVLELHYNNRAGHADVSDTSGVRIYHIPREGDVYGLVTLGPDGFTLPANQRTEVKGQCTVEQEFSILATAPHMHEIGDVLETTLVRADGSEEDVVTLNGWQFETQVYYDTDGLVVRAGDRLKTRCVFENTDNYDRRFGPFTDDEMCYNFLYVTPPAAESRCDEPVADDGYEPGECAAEDAANIGRVFEGDYHLGVPEPLSGGRTPIPGTYRLSRFDIYLSSANYPPVVLDLDAMRSTVAGSLKIEENGQFWLDATGMTHAVTDTGALFDRPINLTFSGVYNPERSMPNLLSLNTMCPGETTLQMPYTFDDDRLIMHQAFQDPTPGVVVMQYERIE